MTTTATSDATLLRSVCEDAADLLCESDGDVLRRLANRSPEDYAARVAVRALDDRGGCVAQAVRDLRALARRLS